jgi:preprotein translocase subunit YajC
MIDHILSFFVSNAYADTAASPAQQGGGTSLILMFVIFFGFIYFAIWRPQNKRAKEQQNLLGSLAKGDEVVTAGGLLGRIAKISDRYITLSVANNADIIMQKSSIVSVLPKGTIKTLE